MDGPKEKFLSFIIPYWHGSYPYIGNLLRMIDFQIGVDFSEIEIIVSSGNMVDNELDFSQYPHIKDSLKFYGKIYEKKGPGQSRQVGLDNATGRYVGFADTDDMLTGLDSFYRIIRALKKAEADNTPFDSMVFNYYDVYGKDVVTRDCREAGVIPFCVWCQFFKRESLLNHNIHFLEDITSFEDVYFVYSGIFSGLRWAFCEDNVYTHLDFETSTGHMYDHSLSALDDCYFFSSKLLEDYKDNPLESLKKEIMIGYLNLGYETLKQNIKADRRLLQVAVDKMSFFMHKFCPNIVEELDNNNYPGASDQLKVFLKKFN